MVQSQPTSISDSNDAVNDAIQQWKANLGKRQAAVFAQVHNQVIEMLAQLEHEQWAHWTNHMLRNMTPENMARWLTQAEMSYADLSEKDKEKDRKWAAKVFVKCFDPIRIAITHFILEELRLLEEQRSKETPQ